MAKSSSISGTAKAIELMHLRREVKTALELAIVTLAPLEVIDRLGLAAGLLEAMSELPLDSAPAVALGPKLVSRAKSALAAWGRWEKDHTRKALA